MNAAVFWRNMGMSGICSMRIKVLARSAASFVLVGEGAGGSVDVDHGHCGLPVVRCVVRIAPWSLWAT